MHTAVALFIAISIIELLIWFPAFWEIRRAISKLVVVFLVAVTLNLVLNRASLWMYVVAFFSFYRIVNLLRIIKNRVQTDYLHKTSSVTSLMIIAMQLGVILIVSLIEYMGLSSFSTLKLLAVIQLMAAGIIFISTKRHLRTTKPISLTKTYTDRELPTLTVAIPARNETENLNQCLESLVRSSYPKFEILVLDDCSQNKRTPEIIREFAVKGVRFIAGKVPPEKWLAKNYAYQQLVDEASGELLIFCGVDVRFDPGSIKALVELSLEKHKTMISLIPANSLGGKLRIWPLMVQPSRYAWELALPRRWFKRPAVLSTCWMIRKDLLLNSGGFGAVANSVSPESYFARQSIDTSDGYSFMQTDNRVNISSVKNIGDQRDTAVRTRYPQLHRRPEMTAIVTLAEFIALVSPIILLVSSLVDFNWLLLFASLVSACLQFVSYGKIVDLTYKSLVWTGYLALPLAAVYDLFLLNYSMLRYEFGEVIWKDRNVCIPVMNTQNDPVNYRNN